MFLLFHLQHRQVLLRVISHRFGLFHFFSFFHFFHSLIPIRSIAKFYSESGYGADVAACRESFPGMLTFADFLRLTHWGDASRTYEQGISFGGGVPVAVAGGSSGSSGSAQAAVAK